MASFKEAFTNARKKMGPGGTFVWRGKSYTTDLAGEGKSGKSSPGAAVARDTMVALGRAAPSTPAAKAAANTPAKPIPAPEKIGGPEPIGSDKRPKARPNSVRQAANLDKAGRGGKAPTQAKGLDKPGRSSNTSKPTPGGVVKANAMMRNAGAAARQAAKASEQRKNSADKKRK